MLGKIQTRNGVMVRKSMPCAYGHHSECTTPECLCNCHTGKPGRQDPEPGKSYRVSARERSHRRHLMSME